MGGQTPWVTGDVITADRLNGMMVEPLVCHDIDGSGELDASYNDIKNAVDAGRPVYLLYEEEGMSGLRSLCDVRVQDSGMITYSALFIVVTSGYVSAVEYCQGSDPDAHLWING